MWRNGMRTGLIFPEFNRFLAAHCLAVVLLVTVGCNTLPPAACARIIAADREYQNGRYDAARHMLDEVIRQHPKIPETAEAFYIRGLCTARARDNAAATSDFAQCLALSRRTDLTARAHAGLGDLAYAAGAYAEACKHLAAALRDLREEPPADEIRYRYAVALQREARWDEARQELAFILHRYKGGRNAADVGRRFRWQAGNFAIQCGAYRDGTSAEGLVKKLKSAKLNARSAFEGREEGPLHVVYVGQYASYDQARGALASVRAIVPDAQVVP